MCRMLAISGNFSDDYPDIMMAFSDVTRKDPLADAKKSRSESHPDGWGLVHHAIGAIHHEKHELPFFNDKIQEFGSGNLILHARQAAPGEPMGVTRAHPFFATDGVYDVFLCHNGWFDKDAISHEMSLDHPENYVDTEIFLKYTMSFPGTIHEKLNKSLGASFRKNMVKSSANILALSINRKHNSAEILYYTNVSESNEYDEYYRLYLIVSAHWKGVFSSSIIKSPNFPKNCKISEVPRGRILSINVQ